MYITAFSLVFHLFAFLNGLFQQFWNKNVYMQHANATCKMSCQMQKTVNKVIYYVVRIYIGEIVYLFCKAFKVLQTFYIYVHNLFTNCFSKPIMKYFAHQLIKVKKICSPRAGAGMAPSFVSTTVYDSETKIFNIKFSSAQKFRYL